MNKGILNPPSFFSQLIARVKFGDSPHWQLSRTDKAYFPIPLISSPAYLWVLFLWRTCYLYTYCIYVKFVMGWMTAGSNPSGGKKSTLLHANSDWPWGQPTLWYNGYWGWSSQGAALNIHHQPAPSLNERSIKVYLWPPHLPHHHVSKCWLTNHISYILWRCVLLCILISALELNTHSDLQKIRI